MKQLTILAALCLSFSAYSQMTYVHTVDNQGWSFGSVDLVHMQDYGIVYAYQNKYWDWVRIIDMDLNIIAEIDIDGYGDDWIVHYPSQYVFDTDADIEFLLRNVANSKMYFVDNGEINFLANDLIAKGGSKDACESGAFFNVEGIQYMVLYHVNTGDLLKYQLGGSLDCCLCNSPVDGLQGCIYPGAENYDPLATVDTGACLFNSCPADLNNDEIVSTSDLLIFLQLFGQGCG